LSTLPKLGPSLPQQDPGEWAKLIGQAGTTRVCLVAAQWRLRQWVAAHEDLGFDAVEAIWRAALDWRRCYVSVAPVMVSPC